MRKSLGLALVIGLLVLATWLGGAGTAHAIQSCEFLNGRFCANEGATTFCRWDDTPYTSECTCSGNHWFC
jgi:hypothetical protein